MRRRGIHRLGGNGHVELNVIPLIDVVFFLLVFYVISTSFDTVEAVPVDRPASSRATQVQSGFVHVAVVKSGAIHVGPLVVDLASLPDTVRAALAHADATRVLVVADREVPTGLLLKVMDACEAGGAKAVDVAADKGR
jgi:biopolymer transport protein ExbD